MYFCQKTKDIKLGQKLGTLLATQGKQVTNVFLQKVCYDKTINMHESNLNFEVSTFVPEIQLI